MRPRKNGVLVLLAVVVTVAAAPQVRAADDVPEAVLQAERQRGEAIAQASRTAVAVFAADGNGGGSGVVISPDGYALSNFHVTSPVGDYLKCGMADGRLYDAVIVGIDPTGDVALIKLFGRDDFPCADMGDSDQVRAGDWCFAVGNPFLLATDFQPTVTYGIVSGVHRYQYPAGTLLEYADCIQTDASINPGNSGGPLFDAAGRLIGINGRGSFEKRGRVNVGLGYAISINQIKNFLGHLRSGRIVDHATLGATVVSDEGGRVVVSNILETSDAYRRGLRYGDEIIAFGGRRIGSVNTFKNVLGIYPRGWRVPLSYLRNGRRYDVFVRLTGVHAREKLLEMVGRSGRREPPKRQPAPDGEDPQPPPPAPHPQPQQVKIPEEIAGYIKSRSGFANYYFNEQNRQRVWEAFVRHGDFSDAQGAWLLAGRTTHGERATFLLDEDESTAVFADSRATVSSQRDLSEQLAPARSGGLLAALHVWRRLLVAGPQQFGEVVYLGTQPLVGRQELYDVLTATHDVVEVHASFDPASGRLEVLEMFPEIDTDPCEIYFGDYRQVGGREVPHRLIVRHGDGVFAEIHFDEVKLAEKPEPEA